MHEEASAAVFRTACMPHDDSWDVFQLSVPLPPRRKNEKEKLIPSEGSAELSFTSSAAELPAVAKSWLAWATQSGLRVVSSQPPSMLGCAYTFADDVTTVSIHAVHMPGDPASILIRVSQAKAVPRSVLRDGTVTLGDYSVPVPTCCTTGSRMLLEGLSDEHAFESNELNKPMIEALYVPWATSVGLRLADRVDESPGASSGDVCLVFADTTNAELSVHFHEKRGRRRARLVLGLVHDA